MSRIDKFLWYARFYKSRTLATASVSDGSVRLNGAHCTKPATAIKAGDVLTIAAGGRVRIVKVVALGERRGPASEARELYEDLTPPPSPRDADDLQLAPSPERRPSKHERKAIVSLKNKTFDE